MSVVRWATNLFKRQKGIRKFVTESDQRYVSTQERITNMQVGLGSERSTEDIFDEKYWLFGQPDLEEESSFVSMKVTRKGWLTGR